MRGCDGGSARKVPRGDRRENPDVVPHVSERKGVLGMNGSYTRAMRGLCFFFAIALVGCAGSGKVIPSPAGSITHATQRAAQDLTSAPGCIDPGTCGPYCGPANPDCSIIISGPPVGIPPPNPPPMQQPPVYPQPQCGDEFAGMPISAWHQCYVAYAWRI